MPALPADEVADESARQAACAEERGPLGANERWDLTSCMKITDQNGDRMAAYNNEETATAEMDNKVMEYIIIAVVALVLLILIIFLVRKFMRKNDDGYQSDY